MNNIDIEIEKSNIDDGKIATKVSVITVLVNIALTVAKFLVGIFAYSEALLSDAIHSASDVLSTLIALIGIRFAQKEADDKHQYGHERLESIAAIILAFILALTGIGIGADGIEKLKNPELISKTPGVLALVIALISILLKEWMYRYTKRAAQEINSGALLADAWHHRSDAMSSIGAFVGILGARMGYPIFDTISSIVISGFILKAAFDIFKDAMEKMVDKSCDKETIDYMRNIIENIEGILHIDFLHTRIFGNKIYVDVEITVDGSITLKQAHRIAENVHSEIEGKIPKVKHCMVHVNPDDEDF